MKQYKAELEGVCVTVGTAILNGVVRKGPLWGELAMGHLGEGQRFDFMALYRACCPERGSTEVD